jgi:hypothetical protein
LARKQRARDLNEGLKATGVLTVKHDTTLYAYVSLKSGRVMTTLSDGQLMALYKLKNYLRHAPTSTEGFAHRTVEEVDKLLPRFELRRFRIVDDGKP